jgi:hypothetical protein
MLCSVLAYLIRTDCAINPLTDMCKVDRVVVNWIWGVITRVQILHCFHQLTFQ